MTDRVLCPWCGAEMKFEENFIFCRFTCPKCGAASPLKSLWNESFMALTETRAEAKAAALRRYTPPMKPMTFEEVERIVCSSDLNDEMPMYLEDADGDNGWEISYQMTYLCRALKDDYGKTWRCWERKPTDEERSAAEWET